MVFNMTLFRNKVMENEWNQYIDEVICQYSVLLYMLYQCVSAESINFSIVKDGPAQSPHTVWAVHVCMHGTHALLFSFCVCAVLPPFHLHATSVFSHLVSEKIAFLLLVQERLHPHTVGFQSNELELQGKCRKRKRKVPFLWNYWQSQQRI